VERDGRPIEQFRDKYYASIHGLHYEFPPPATKKRKRQALGMTATEPAAEESDRKRVDTGSSKMENTSADTISQVGEPSSSASSDGVEDEPVTVRGLASISGLATLLMRLHYARITPNKGCGLILGPSIRIRSYHF
jgi:hypothetical protein